MLDGLWPRFTDTTTIASMEPIRIFAYAIPLFQGRNPLLSSGTWRDRSDHLAQYPLLPRNFSSFEPSRHLVRINIGHEDFKELARILPAELIQLVQNASSRLLDCEDSRRGSHVRLHPLYKVVSATTSNEE